MGLLAFFHGNLNYRIQGVSLFFRTEPDIFYQRIDDVGQARLEIASISRTRTNHVVTWRHKMLIGRKMSHICSSTSEDGVEPQDFEFTTKNVSR